MEEVFDTFTRKTKLYYALQLSTIAFFLFLFIAYQYNLQGYKWVLITVVLVGLLITLTNMLLTATNIVKMYVANGQLVISLEDIKINSTTIYLSDTKKIGITTNDYRGARTSDGSGNRIEITSKDNKTLKYRFVIKSKEQRDKLREILKQWQANGNIVESIGF